MSKFNSYIGENGALTPDGKKMFNEFMSTFKKVLGYDDLMEMSDSEIRHLSCLLKQTVGNFISEISD